MGFVKFIRAVFSAPSDPRTRSTGLFLRVCFASLVVGVIWAHFSKIDQVVTAQGKVIPQSRIQTVQHLEGGRITQIHVRPGQVVKADEVLISLSPLEQNSDYQTQLYNLLSLIAKVDRLQAQYAGRPLLFSATLQKDAPDATVNEGALFEAQQRQLQALLSSHDSLVRQKEIDIRDARGQLQGATRALEISQEEYTATRRLVEQGLEPRLSELASERVFTEAGIRKNGATELVNRRIAEREEALERKNVTLQDSKSNLLTELTKGRTDLQTLQNTLPVAAGKVDRTSIRSPIGGVVNRVLVSTEGGGVVKPNDPVIEIVPEGTLLVLEVNLLPSDIGFVRQGQDAIIKLTTYDFSVYGTMSGQVSVVSADTITNERGESFYIVKIEASSQTFESQGRHLPVIPGMAAQVDIVTNKRTVLSYVMSPFTRALKAAFREK
jgi:adhesin transport system membrane fusion protein